jgi:hypothetical protein
MNGELQRMAMLVFAVSADPRRWINWDAGQDSVRINDQFRICFRSSEGDAYDVDITDYH